MVLVCYPLEYTSIQYTQDHQLRSHDQANELNIKMIFSTCPGFPYKWRARILVRF